MRHALILVIAFALASVAGAQTAEKPWKTWWNQIVAEVSPHVQHALKSSNSVVQEAETWFRRADLPEKYNLLREFWDNRDSLDPIMLLSPNILENLTGIPRTQIATAESMFSLKF